MKNVLLFLCLGISQSMFSQSKLAGFVTEQNSGKRPVADALIKSGGANQIRSSSTGQFIITYQDLPAGKNVYVQVEKDGWEVVNEKELNTFIPANSDEKPLKIILCKAGTLATAKKEYYNIVDDYITKKYNRKLIEINREKEGWQKEVAKLNEQLESLQKQLNNNADEFSRLNLDDLNEIEIKAFNLFKEGKIEESIQLRESLHSDSEIRKSVTEKVLQDSIIYSHTENILSLAYSYQLQYNFELAEQTYEKLAEADTTNYKNYFAYAKYLQDQNKLDKAIYIYKKTIDLTKNEGELADIYNNLGNIYQLTNNDTLAFKTYQKALKITENLAEIDPEKYEDDLFTTLTNIGVFHFYTKNYDAALEVLLKADKLILQIGKYNPFHHGSPSSVKLLQQIGKVYFEINDYSSSEWYFRYALFVMHDTSDIFDWKKPYLAKIHFDLGRLYEKINDSNRAIFHFNNAIQFFKRSNNISPNIIALKLSLKIFPLQKYDYDIALSFLYIGNIMYKSNEYDSAISNYSNALKLFQNLAKDSTNYAFEVATILYTLGDLFHIKNNFPETLNAQTKALEIYERLAKNNPETYEPYVAITQKKLGFLYDAKNDYPAALNAYLKALEINERLAKNDPDGYEIEFSQSLVLLSLLQKENYHANRQNQVNEYLEKAKQILPKYQHLPLGKTLLDFVYDLEEYFKNLKIFLLIETLQNQVEKEEKYSKKIIIREKIIKNYRDLIVHGSPKFADDLGINLGSLAWYQLFEKQFAEAEKSVKEALNPITFNKTEYYDTKIEWANANLALALLFQGKYADAVKIYVALKDKPYSKATYRETFLADLEELEKAGITHPDVVKIRELLKK